MRLVWTGAGVSASLALSLLFSPAALAQTAGPEPAKQASQPGDDEVSLKNGGIVRGTVVELMPGEQVRILVAGEAEPRSYPWSEVADVKRGATAPPNAVEQGEDALGEADLTGVVGYTQPATEPPEAGKVRVHIETDEVVTLFRIAGGMVGYAGGYAVSAAYFESVCTSPCDKMVDGSNGESFVVAGDGVPESDAFSLAGWSDDATVRVDPGSTAGRVGGWIAIWTGVTAAATGGGFLLAGALLDDSVTGTEPPPFTEIGAGLMIGGGTAIVGGIVLAVLSGTDVEVVPSAPQTGSYKPATRPPSYLRGEF